ncbi:hypothetical protein KI387_030822, partial [Taxus chinensis]
RPRIQRAEIMVSTRRGSAGLKRASSSPDLPGSKRSKAEVQPDEECVRADDSVNSKELASSSSPHEHLQADLQNDLSRDAVMADVPETTNKGNEASSVEGEGAEKSVEAPPTSELEKPKASPAASRLQKHDMSRTWGKLISQYQQNPSVELRGTNFTIGRSRHCSFCIKDPTISTILCKLKHTMRDGAIAVVLEIIGNNGWVQLNGKSLKKTNVVIKGGDELIFSSSGNHAYVFELLLNENISATPLPTSVSMTENQTVTGKAPPFEARSGDPSAVAGASILASLSSLRQEISMLPPPAANGEEIGQGLDRPQIPPPCDMSDGSVSDIDVAGQAGKGTSDPAGAARNSHE